MCVCVCVVGVVIVVIINELSSFWVRRMHIIISVHAHYAATHSKPLATHSHVNQ